jgi:hypothetical protein
MSNFFIYRSSFMGYGVKRVGCHKMAEPEMALLLANS